METEINPMGEKAILQEGIENIVMAAEWFGALPPASGGYIWL